MSDPELKCTIISHQWKAINGICVNKDCDKTRPVCFLCSRENHKNHQEDLYDFQEFQTWRQEGVTVHEQAKFMLGELESVAYLLRELIPMYNIKENFNLLTSTTEDINREVKNLLNMKSFGSVLSNDLQQLSEWLQIVKKKCKELKQSKDQPPQQCQQQITKNEIIQPQRPIIIEQQVKIIQQVQVAQRLQFKFSQEYKHSDANIRDQGNVVEFSKRTFFGFCICERVIPNNGVTRVGFKMIQCFNIFIGVCQRDAIKQSNYQPDIDRIGHGCYLIGKYGYSYSNHQEEINNKRQEFRFQTNDIIIVEIGNKKIIWINKESNETFTMPFNLQGDLSYCVGFTSSYGDQVVEIINWV